MSRHCLWCFIENLCTFHKKLNCFKSTWISVAVAAVSLWINSDHIGNVGTFNIHFVEHLLTNVVKFIGENSTLNPNGIVSRLANKTVSHLSKPPDALIKILLPFLYHWLRTAKIERLISTQNIIKLQ